MKSELNALFADDGCHELIGTDNLHVVPFASDGMDSYSTNLFIAALVDHLCSLYVPNSRKKDKLFKSKFLHSFHASEIKRVICLPWLLIVLLICNSFAWGVGKYYVGPAIAVSG